MSHYADYVGERLGKLVYETSQGFVLYWFPKHKEHGEVVYIEDIYVVASERRSGVAADMADYVCEAARARGVSVLIGSVNPEAKGATTSLKVLLGYGMSLDRVGQDGLIYFSKSLED